ncbi:MAG: preprotein translocase subunit YajC [Alphaproteobacteria bacterium]|nr:preprotein translocase subunit YajC [Alphaproteobacteria bacterium]
MFILDANAQSTGGGGGGDIFGALAPLLFIFVIFYFLLIRPQQKKQKAHQAMLASAKKGDTVYTGGGIRGRVLKVHEEKGELDVEIADGVRIRVLRSSLLSVEVKEEPASKSDSQSDSKADASEGSDS